MLSSDLVEKRIENAECRAKWYGTRNGMVYDVGMRKRWGELEWPGMAVHYNINFGVQRS